MRVAVFQCDCANMDTAHRLEALQNEINTHDCDVMVVPELFLSGYNVGSKLARFAMCDDSPLHGWMSKLAQSTATAILYSFPEQSGDDLFNAARLIGSSGETIQHHRKIAIPPGPEREVFVSGQGSNVFEFSGLKCAILICYDSEFPETVRRVASQGAEVVFVPTALSSEWSSVADQLIPTRAFENGVWLVYANHAGNENGLEYCGRSVIVTPQGQDAVRAGHSVETITATLDQLAVGAAQERLPYLVDYKFI